MLTYSAITKVKEREQAEGLGVALEKLNPPPMGVGVFELEDGSGEWEVGAYFHDRPDEISILILENAFKADGFAISEIPETDWVTKVKRELSPLKLDSFLFSVNTMLINCQRIVLDYSSKLQWPLVLGTMEQQKAVF